MKLVRYRAKEKTFIMHYGVSDKEKHTVMIVEQNDSGVWMPCSLTHYIYDNYSNRAINTQLSVAYTICNFMNYILDQIEAEDELFANLKAEGLFGLKFHHGALFLNYVGNEIEPSNSYETVLRKENELTKFYDFLHSRGITNTDMQIAFRIEENRAKTFMNFDNAIASGMGKKVLISPFHNDSRCDVKVIYPPNDGQNRLILKDMRQADWELFLEVAEEVTPDIALGVAMTCMGGIRKGEVVNLTLTSYKKDEKNHRLILSIQDRQNSLFKARGIKTDKSQVKQLREDQPVFNFNGSLFIMLDNHLKRLKARGNLNTSALFVDSKGNPMTGEVYSRRFYILKRAFLNKLAERKPALAKEYAEHYSWGTHIGRHIYTNHLIKTGLCNDSLGIPEPRTLANLRGDDDIRSAMDYIDNTAIIESIQDRLEQLSRIAVEI